MTITEKLSRKSRKLINVQLVKRASKEKILQPLLDRATMSAQYRNKVLNRVRSRKDDYYFFYYLFLRVMFLLRSRVGGAHRGDSDGKRAAERLRRVGAVALISVSVWRSVARAVEGALSKGKQ